MRIAVVHLIRKKNSIKLFEGFWSSYLSHQAGKPHDVILVFKGFESCEIDDIFPYHKIIGNVPTKNLYISDKGNDIDVYFRIARQFDYDAFVFLNSWSRIKRDGWLRIMSERLEAEKADLVATSTSKESHTDNIERFMIGIKKLRLFPLFMFFYTFFPRFPNFHVRTNGFMVLRSVLLKVRKPLMLSKFDAWAFESGRNGMTRQIQRQGYAIASLDEHQLIGDNHV